MSEQRENGTKGADDPMSREALLRRGAEVHAELAQREPRTGVWRSSEAPASAFSPAPTVAKKQEPREERPRPHLPETRGEETMTDTHVVHHDRDDDRRGLSGVAVAVLLVLALIVGGVLTYTLLPSSQGFDDADITSATIAALKSEEGRRAVAEAVPEYEVQLPSDLARKSDLADIKTTIDPKAFDETYVDTVKVPFKDPVTGKADTTEVYKTRTRNLFTDMQKELENTKAEARAAKVAARNAEKRLKGTPQQFTVNVPSGIQTPATAMPQATPTPLPPAQTATPQASWQSGATSSPGLVTGTLGGGSPPPPPASSLASSASAALALVGGEICYTDGTYTYISKQVLVGMNGDGTERAATPSDGKFYVVGGNMFPWAPTEARQILEDRGDWLAFKAVPPAGIQVVWKDPSDARSEGGLVWSPAHKFEGLPGVYINRATGEYKYKPVHH